MTFDAFREHGEPSFFSAVHVAWEADLLVCGLVYAFAILFFSFCLLVPGLGGGEKLFFIIRVFISLFIGASILITNFAMTWDTAEITALTKYKAGLGHDINASIGLHIGLRGVNITLKADDHAIAGETIDYNERFSWEGLQGRLGFGPFAGQFNREYRAAQFRGLPLPILWVAEYFTLDGEGIRWGRHYRQAGWYTHIMLWLAFPLWVLSNFLFFVLLRYGAYFMGLTGLSMLTANIIWATYRNPLDLTIRFTDQEALDLSFGTSFWICLFVGLLCIFLGFTVFWMDKMLPKQIAFFFGVDILQDSESIQIEDAQEVTIIDDKATYSNMAFNTDGDDTQMSPTDTESFYEDLRPQPSQTQPGRPEPLQISIKKDNPSRSFKSGEHRLTLKWQRSRRQGSQHQGRSPSSSSGFYSVPSTSSGSNDLPLQDITTRI